MVYLKIHSYAHNFFPEPFIFFKEAKLKNSEKFDKNLSDEAKDVLMGKNWSSVFFTYLAPIDFEQNGSFDKWFKLEKSAILKELEAEYPNVHSIDRLCLQYAAILANWR